MNLREALTAAVDQFEELPASEIIRKVESILNDETLSDGCSIVEVCHNDSVLGYNEQSEPF